MTDLTKLKELLGKATPGPWAYMDDGFCGYIESAPSGNWTSFGGEPSEGRLEGDDPNVQFVVAAVNALPELIAEVERLRTYAKMIGEQNDCNTCTIKNCEIAPGWGKVVRINCACWRGEMEGNGND